ncbi:hypothetical protein AJ80_01917 [Polytolypa hystricis UAMH7299]|uniref:Chitin biosynthesis protein CHS5 n=1 Tax=Polytolypa hystricis (strain UAMH7299) TaxID=1447883 RepID=A0A2B7YZK5_POLH7|nr:hypothetical protein AJ80_01917 [Polytolypa hystricis UAMH7299]
MLVSLTVGKVDAGVAVLLTEDNRLIEFPSVLLPNNITSGSIVDITVSRNLAAEAASVSAFQALQKRILHTYGINTPSPPILRLRNATQTSLVLEWEPINLATASLKTLSLYRNDSKAGSIPRPLEMLSTKISGLAIDTEYTFQLVLRTTAGTFSSEKLVCRTHKMTDLSGITITPGVLPPDLKVSLGEAVRRIGAKMVDTVRIDTTHFVCTEGRGAAWEKAVEMNIPVVRPEWVEGCEREGTIVGVRSYYLNADPKMRQIGPGIGANQNRQHAILNQSASPSSGRPSNVDTSLRHNKSPSVQEPPNTPFPGAPTNVSQNGEKAEEELSETPPPPPPKDDSPEAEEDDTESTGPSEPATYDEEDGTGETDVAEDGESSESTPTAKVSSEAESGSETTALPTSKGDSSSKDVRKTNGTGGEEEKLDEIPL